MEFEFMLPFNNKRQKKHKTVNLIVTLKNFSSNNLHSKLKEEKKERKKERREEKEKLNRIIYKLNISYKIN